MAANIALGIPGSKFNADIQDGTDWVRIPGGVSLSSSSGQAPTTDNPGFDNTETVTGEEPPPTFTYNYSKFAPVHRSTQVLNDRKRKGQSVNLRLWQTRTEVEASATGRTVAIATTGVCTFSQAGGATAIDFAERNDIGINHALYDASSGEVYPIDSISADGTVVVYPKPTGAVTAFEFAVIRPVMVLGPFSVNVVGSPGQNFDVSSDSSMSATLTLQAVAALADWTAQYTAPA